MEMITRRPAGAASIAAVVGCSLATHYELVEAVRVVAGVLRARVAGRRSGILVALAGAPGRSVLASCSSSIRSRRWGRGDVKLRQELGRSADRKCSYTVAVTH